MVDKMNNPTAIPSEHLQHAVDITNKLVNNINTIIRGKDEVIFNIIIALISGGNVLLEDFPGSGKTTLAKTIALSIAADENKPIQFKRIQFTPDLLPTDILGVNIYLPDEHRFNFQPGPIFTHVLLADEINRSGPKVQAALLEAMAEKQVTIDNTTYSMEDLFVVLATQNPLEIAGTYPLPLVQLDRFLFKLHLGYVTQEIEKDILKNYKTIQNLAQIQPVCGMKDILKLRELSQQVYLSEEVYNCIAAFTKQTRNHPDIVLGASTRSAIFFVQSVKTRALLLGRSYVIEDDLKQLLDKVFLHRMQMSHHIEDKKQLLFDLYIPLAEKHLHQLK